MVCRWRSAHKQLVLFSDTCHLFFKVGFTTPVSEADLRHKHIHHNKITTKHHDDSWFYHLREEHRGANKYSQIKFSAVSFELLDCGFPPPTTNVCSAKESSYPFCNTSRAPRREEVTFPQQKQYLNVAIPSKAANIYETQ